MSQTELKNNGMNPEASGSNKRWSVLILCALAYLYDSLDLQILAICLPVIIPELNLDPASGGLLASATMVGTAIGGVFFGWVADNYGRKLAVTLGLIEFGVFTVGIYWADTWGQLMALRFLAGIGIGGLWGPLVALIAEHWIPKFRTRANAFVLSTFALGGIFAALMGRFILGVIDWRWIFVLTGTSIIAGVIFYALIPETKQLPAKAKANQTAVEKVKLSECFSDGMAKTTILATCVAAVQMAGYWGALTWVPSYLVQVRGLSLQIMANFSIFMFVGAFAGYFIYAALADKIGRRKALMVAFLCDAIFVPSYVILPSADWVFWLGPVMGMSFGGVFGLLGSYFSSLFPDRTRATGSGFAFNIGRGFGAVVAPYTVGVIAKTQGLSVGIGTLTIIFVFGIIALAFMPNSYADIKRVKEAEK